MIGRDVAADAIEATRGELERWIAGRAALWLDGCREWEAWQAVLRSLCPVPRAAAGVLLGRERWLEVELERLESVTPALRAWLESPEGRLASGAAAAAEARWLLEQVRKLRELYGRKGAGA